MHPRFPSQAAALLLLGSATILRADESGPADPGKALVTTINEVQLYSDQAMVRRRGRMELAAGVTIFRVKDLPARLINDSVRMSLDEGGAKISEIRVETRHEKVFRSERAKEAETLLREAESKLRRLTDEYNSIREEETHIKAIRFGQSTDHTPDKLKRETANAGVFRDTLDFVQKSLKRNQSRLGELLQDIDKAREEMTVAMSVVERYRSVIDTEKKEVYIAVEAKEARKGAFQLEYRMTGAGWYPAYSARVLTQKGSDMTKADVRLSSYAFVKNETGEDWDRVRLLFSAADPDESARIPELAEWRIKARLEEVAKADADDSPDTGYKDRSRSKKRMMKEAEAEPTKPANSPSAKGRGGPSGGAQAYEPNQVMDELRPQEQAVQQSVEGQSRRSRDYYSQNQSIIKDERAKKKSVAAERNINEMRSSLAAQKSAMGRGDYESVIESGERIMDSIRRLDPKYRRLFADEEAETAKARNQSLRLMESRRLAGRLVSPRDSARGFDYRYAAAIPETVRSDGTLHKVMLSEKPMQASLVFEAAPLRLPTAFLTGRVQLKGDAPLLSGPVSVFNNTDYTGESMIRSVSSGELFRLHLGADEDIQITRNEEEFRETSGVFSKNYNFSRKITIVVKNGKKKPVTIDVFDRTPHSSDERIKVTDVSPLPKPSEQTKDGFVRFRLNLAANEKQTIEIKYRLSHPADVLPIYSEAGGPQW